MTTQSTPLLTSPDHREYLLGQARGLLAFGTRFPAPGGGSGWLTNDGALDPTKPIHTWITCRMTHVYSLGHLLGVPGSKDLAQQAFEGLRGPLYDSCHGGWFASIPGPSQAAADASTDELGHPVGADTTKSAYAHAFVILAASSAVKAGLDGAHELLELALTTFEERFFDAEFGLHVDEWDAAFSTLDPYRGINANMHAVEALLAAGDVTGDAKWHNRALGVCKTVALEWAAAQNWRIPEHYSLDWEPVLEFNADRPDDPFKPYGATPGHGIEWARLFLHLDSTLGAGTHPWLVDSAIKLYDRAIADGWRQSDQGAWGFVYTTDWSGEPVVETRMHWVAAEALAAAATLYTATADARYAADYERWLDHIQTYLLDPELGSWHHELNAANEPVAKVWPGKPDIYHAFQAMLFPLVPLSPSLSSTAADLG